MKLSMRHSLIVLATLLTFSTSALAQFVWLDETGNKQFSDQPPPASVPKNKILKFAGKTTAGQNALPVAEEKVKLPENLADKELAFKKRQGELAAKEKKEAEESKVAAAKTDNCKRMQEYKKSLDSGERISQTDATGARGYMSDEKRIKEQAEIGQNMKDCGS